MWTNHQFPPLPLWEKEINESLTVFSGLGECIQYSRKYLYPSHRTFHSTKYTVHVCLFGPPSPPPPPFYNPSAWIFILLCDFLLLTRKGTVSMCVEAYQGHTLSMLCAMPTVFVYYLTSYPSAKEQFMCLINMQLIGCYSRGMAIMMTAEAFSL